MSESDNDLITLKNSNALFKYPVDAEQLNYNFQYLLDQIGSGKIRFLIESTGQIYSDLLDNQLAAAVAQYVVSGNFFKESGQDNTYILQAANGLVAPTTYTEGMVVTFITTHSNTGASTIQIGELAAYNIRVSNEDILAGYILTNVPLTFILRKATENDTTTYYWEPVSTGGTGGGGGGDTPIQTNYADKAVENIITTAGFAFNENDKTLLSKAVASYISRRIYTCTYNAGTYILKSYDDQFGITSPRNGDFVAFMADEANSATDPSIMINESSRYPLKNYLGETLEVNSILAGDFVYCIYDNGVFKLLSNHQTALSLSSGAEVSSISTDYTFENASDTELATTKAIKDFVSTQVHSLQPNIIQTGYIVNNQPAALVNIGGHVLQLVSAKQTEDTAYVESQPTSPSSMIYSGNVNYAHNVINKIDSTYWPSVESGFAVDGFRRYVGGTTGNKYIAIDTTTYVGTHAFIGFSGLTTLSNYLRIKHTSENETPQSIKFQIAFGSDTTYYDIVTQTGDVSYGFLSSLQTDDDGYFNIEIPKYYNNGGSITPITIGSNIKFKVVATLFNNQFVDQTTLEDPTYDPNNDTTSEQYHWCVSDLILCNLVEAPVFEVIYPSSTASLINGNTYNTQYDFVDEDTDPNLTALDTVPNGSYYIYISKELEEPTLVEQNKLYKSFTNPLPNPTSSDIGSVWFNISTVPATPAILKQNASTNEFEWVAQDLILIGSCTYSSNAVTALNNFRYGTAFGVEYAMTSTFSKNITHNFGSDVDVYCQLICTTANNGYAAGDMITLDNNMTSVYSLPTVTSAGLVTNIGSNTLSYFQVVNTQTQTTIKASNLYIVNTSTNNLVLLPSSGWKLRVYITKD